MSNKVDSSLLDLTCRNVPKLTSILSCVARFCRKEIWDLSRRDNFTRTSECSLMYKTAVLHNHNITTLLYGQKW